MNLQRRLTAFFGIALLFPGIGCDAKQEAPKSNVESPTAEASTKPVAKEASEPSPATKPKPSELSKPSEPPEPSADAAGIPKIVENAAEEANSDPAAVAAEQLLAKSLEAIGGRERLDAIKSFHSHATMEVKGQSLNASIDVWWKNGDYYVETDMAGVGKMRGWKKGTEQWSEDPISGKRKLEGLEARQAAWAASVSVVGSWKEHFETAKLGKTHTLDGKEVVDIEFSGNGMNATLSLDSKTHIPVQQSFTQKGPMGEMPVTVSLEDYREVEGLKVPYRTRTSMTLMDAVQTIETWEVNVEVDASRFSPE